MSEPSQLDLLPPGQAAELLFKRRLWNRTMWISLSAAVVFLIISAEGNISKVMMICLEFNKSGSFETAIMIFSDRSSTSTQIALISLPIALVAFFLFLVSSIRLLSLPKPPLI